MNLLDYARILIRRSWIIILLAGIAAVSAYILSARQQPVYRSSQIVLIQPSRNDLGLTEATNRLMLSYEQYLNSTFRAQEIIDRLNLDMTPQQLKGIATIDANQNNLTMRIDIDLYSGDLANDIAREWGNLLVEYRNEQNQLVRREDRIDAALQDLPTYALLRPRPEVNAVAGAVLGLLLGTVIVFILEWLESSVVRSREDIERSIDLAVLANIPDHSAS